MIILLRRHQPLVASKLIRKKDINIQTEADLISKKKEYKQKIKTSDKDIKKKSINMVMDRHNKFYDNVNQHIKKEINTQEDEFKRQMRQRRERSINRSLSRSMNKGKKGKKGEKDEDTSNILKHLKLDSKEQLDNPFES